jgi:LPXTG-motif cell wall-anchored protein
VTWDLRLRINKAQSAPGTVAINFNANDIGQRRIDLNPADDAAQIRVNPAPGSGGELPVTGGRSGFAAAIGTGLLAAGTVAMLLARRRRTA